MEPITVLIIDNDILVRRAITTILQKHQEFRVFWSDGECEDVVTCTKEKQPDIVLLSIQSIEGNGLDKLQRLKSAFAQLPIVVLSPRDEEGAQAAITSLRLGAIDFITKPETENLILFAERHLEKRLQPLLKAIRKIGTYDNLNKGILESYIHPQKSFEDLHSGSLEDQSIEITVMGGCTGGVQSLFNMLGNLPVDLDFPIVIVQHLPRVFTKYLTTNLDRACAISVQEMEDGAQLLPGSVYIAPGGYQCEVSKSGLNKYVATVYRGAREHSMRPSIDVLFRSAARAGGSKVMGVLLSGCGRDGLAGMEAIHKQGGQVIVEDPRTAIAPILPLKAMMKGIVKAYYPSEDIARALTSLSVSSSGKKAEEDTKQATNFIF
ncbi:chemotaxis protein CheB [Fodinibius sp. Rm-B-1B1-1]|uniref:chemotaxis protein CheB n=1 Tax=Fodinibius alkaliphilus TaxID=3140241 RepID=UPI00315B079B